MSRIKLVSACALFLAGLLATAGTASAQSTQQDYVIRGMTAGSYYGGGGGNVYQGGYAAPAAAPDYSSYYAPRAEYIVPRDAALIDMQLPANAEVWFSGEKTTQDGAARSFVTPALEQGHRYAYQIKVRWKDSNGKTVEREQKVAVRPGSRLNLRFE
jgi:uncharacterized protein (TIGR03000 family)